MKMVELLEDETLDDLNKINRKIIQKKNGFRFSIDAVLIANFLDVKKNINILDIGTGTGIIPILISDNDKIEKIYALEIQENIADMSERSVKYNLLEEKIKIINKDIKEFKADIKFDMIVTNPPYIKVSDGKLSDNTVKAASKHEVKLRIEELIENAKRLLKSGGSFNIIYRTNRFQELVEVLGKNNFFIKRLRFIHSKPNNNSGLFMIEALKEKRCPINIETPLWIYDSEGNYTEEVCRYY